VPLAERGRRRLQARLVTSSQEAQSLPEPDEGSAFNGWTGLDERRRQCCRDNVGCKPPVQAKKCGGCVTNRRGGALEGARAIATARGSPSQRCPSYGLAPYRRSASLREEVKTRAKTLRRQGPRSRDKTRLRSARIRRVETSTHAINRKPGKTACRPARHNS
jgi:hypothetical protein